MNRFLRSVRAKSPHLHDESAPPATRRDVIRFLSERGWDGPRPGGNHDFMIKGSHRQVIPGDREIPAPFLLRLLKQAGYTRQDWLNR